MKSANQLIRYAAECALIQATFMAGAFRAEASGPLDPDRLISSLNARLEAANTPSDSIPTLYDIFDLSLPEERLEHVKRLYDTATRAGNLIVQFDMLRQWARYGALVHNEAIVDEAFELARTMPDSEDQRQTLAYIRACRATAHRYKSPAERSNYLRQLLKTCADMPDNTDPYERVAQLFGLVEVLGQETRGALLSEYVDKLDKAISALPKLPHNFLRSRFNSFAAPAYLDNDETAKSVKTDRSQLLILDRQLKNGRAAGRFYMNLDVQRYVCLRRMLRSYEALSDSELRNCYKQVLEIADRNPEVAANLAKDPSPHIGALLLAGKYDEALPLARQQAYNPDASLRDRRTYMRRLIDIADKAGDSELKHAAEAGNAELLEEYAGDYKAAERVRELQILYDVNALRRDQASAQLDRERSRSMMLLAAAGIALALMLIFARLYARERSQRRRLAAEIDSLKSDRRAIESCREELIATRNKVRHAESEKDQLISYIGHELMTPLNAIVDYSQMIIENVHDDSKDYIRRFASIVEINSRILQEIANDIQEFSMLDAAQLPLHPMPANINNLAEITAESVKPQLKPGVSIAVRPNPGNDNTITTDPRRLQIVLFSNIMTLARLSERGALTLSVAIDRKAQQCSLTLTADSAAMTAEELGHFCDNRLVSALRATLAPNPAYTGPGVSTILTIPIN